MIVGKKNAVIPHEKLIHNNVHNNTQKFHLGHLRIKNPELWWPHDHGKQNLYTFNMTMTLGDRTTSLTKVLHIGIRNVTFNP